MHPACQTLRLQGSAYAVRFAPRVQCPRPRIFSDIPRTAARQAEKMTLGLNSIAGAAIKPARLAPMITTSRLSEVIMEWAD
jgi:hypothetical protein